MDAHGSSTVRKGDEEACISCVPSHDPGLTAGHRGSRLAPTGRGRQESYPHMRTEAAVRRQRQRRSFRQRQARFGIGRTYGHAGRLRRLRGREQERAAGRETLAGIPLVVFGCLARPGRRIFQPFFTSRPLPKLQLYNRRLGSCLLSYKTRMIIGRTQIGEQSLSQPSLKPRIGPTLHWRYHVALAFCFL